MNQQNPEHRKQIYRTNDPVFKQINYKKKEKQGERIYWLKK